MSASKKILIIEDDPEMMSLLRDFFSHQGYQVVACSSVPDALPFLSHGGMPACDLVIADIQMKPVDGREFLRQAHATHPQLPVILMSAMNSPQLAREVLHDGARSFVPKPFALGTMATLVRRELSGRKP